MTVKRGRRGGFGIVTHEIRCTSAISGNYILEPVKRALCVQSSSRDIVYIRLAPVIGVIDTLPLPIVMSGGADQIVFTYLYS